MGPQTPPAGRRTASGGGSEVRPHAIAVHRHGPRQPRRHDARLPAERSQNAQRGGAWRRHWTSVWFPTDDSLEPEDLASWKEALEVLQYTLTIGLSEGRRIGFGRGYGSHGRSRGDTHSERRPDPSALRHRHAREVRPETARTSPPAAIRSWGLGRRAHRSAFASQEAW